MKKQLILCYCLLIALPLYAQKLEIKKLPFDSAAFSMRKNQLNSLNTKPFEKLTYHTTGTVLPYRLLSPKETKSNATYPLVIALHNSSRLGIDNENQLEPLTRTWLTAEMRTKFPAFVLAPQFENRPTQYAFNETYQVMTATPQKNLQALLELVIKISKNPQIDAKRIYLIGYSMGGSTALHLLNQKPTLFAAAIAVAGVPDFSNLTRIRNKPIWLIHGKQDDDNPFLGSEKLFEKLKGNTKARFTIYENLNHHTITYPLLTTDELAKWLFKWKLIIP
ncbi:prolyl oligopeptidase family serine peptidase [Pedobacter sp.]|uniref:carboxylesterase family protein n=1 Tax=Pedobacter sp. TaxID=1411316 RepID=UPI0031D4A13E